MSKQTTKVTKKATVKKPAAQVIKAKGVKAKRPSTPVASGSIVFKKKLDLVLFNKIKLDLAHGMSIADITKKYPVGRTTVRRIKAANNLNAYKLNLSAEVSHRKSRRAARTPRPNELVVDSPKAVLGDDKVKLHYVSNKRQKPVSIVAQKSVEQRGAVKTTRTETKVSGWLPELFSWVIVLLVLSGLVWLIVFIIKSIIGLF